nr:MAG TPA: hypothetical protein [Caudoviricetes sp.]
MKNDQPNYSFCPKMAKKRPLHGELVEYQIIIRL